MTLKCRIFIALVGVIAICVPPLAAQSFSSLSVAHDGMPIGLNELFQFRQGTAGSTNDIVEFSVTNTGTKDISLSQKQGAIITGNSVDAFSVVMEPVPLLHPGDTVYFRIQYSPKNAGASFGTVKLVGEDPNKPYYWFFIQALATPAPMGQS